LLNLTQIQVKVLQSDVNLSNSAEVLVFEYQVRAAILSSKLFKVGWILIGCQCFYCSSAE